MMTSAIFAITSTDGRVSRIGETITRILNDTCSIDAVYNYFKKNALFSDYKENSGMYQTRYRYKIPADAWTKITGFLPDWFFRVTLDDGSLFYGTDYTGYHPYIYLSLNKKAPYEIKAEIMNLLKQDHSVKKLIEYFKKNKLFDNYHEQNYNYQIPEEEWEENTDIPREIVDLLPYTDDGSILTMRNSDFDTEYRYINIVSH